MWKKQYGCDKDARQWHVYIRILISLEIGTRGREIFQNVNGMECALSITQKIICILRTVPERTLTREKSKLM